MPVKFVVLSSGSRGNCALISDGETRILIDAGINVTQLRARLAEIGETLSGIDAVVASHEHTDHIAALPVLARSRDLRASFHVAELAVPEIHWNGAGVPSRLQTFKGGDSFMLGAIQVETFPVPHDAVDPVGFLFTAASVKVAVCTDLGHLDETVASYLRQANILLLESNHDLDILRIGPYPFSVRQRVMSRTGHLSNVATTDFLRADLGADTSAVILGHLSLLNNHPEIVRHGALQALTDAGRSPEFHIAEQGRVSKVFCL